MTAVAPAPSPPFRKTSTRPFWVWLVPLIVYAGIVIPLGWIQRDRLNPDAICYIQRARYLLQGDFYHAVSDYWSPLISWCIAPLLAMGIDGLYAARIVLCIWGALLLLSIHAFLGAITSLGPIWRTLALVAMAIFLAPIAVRQITPDVILATLLFVYFTIILHPEMLRRRSLQFATGIVGGIAYLAKAYALPFFIVHAPMTLLLHAWAGRGSSGIRSAVAKASAASLLAISGCLLLVLPWASVLTWRYGHFTVTAVGTRAHALTLAPDVQPSINRYFGPPPGPYLIRSEAQETIPYPFWSPFDSLKHFKRQMEVMGNHALRIAGTIGNLDLFHLAPIGIVLAPILLLKLQFRRPGREIVWLLGSMALYCSGFLPVYYTPRYLLPILMPLILVLCLKLIWESDLPRRLAGQSVGRYLPPVLSAFVLASFALAAVDGGDSLGKQPTARLHRAVGQAIRARGLASHMACPSRADGMCVAYHAGTKFIGFPVTQSVDEAEQQLRSHQAVLVIWTQRKTDKATAAATELARAAVQRPGWRLVFKRQSRKAGRVAVYVHDGQLPASPGE